MNKAFLTENAAAKDQREMGVEWGEELYRKLLSWSERAVSKAQIENVGIPCLIVFA